MCYDDDDDCYYFADAEPDSPTMPLIGEEAPPFSAVTTQGVINFPDDYQGKWVILFSHPADFTPVCTTEFMTFARMMPQFESLNCKLIGLSIDSNFSHIAWLRTIKEKIKYKDMEGVEVTFPVIADLKMEVAKLYGMVHPTTDDSHAIRAVFIMDPRCQGAGDFVLSVLDRPQFPGDHANADRHANGRQAPGGHAGRLAAGRRCNRTSARLVRDGPGANDRARQGHGMPRLVHVSEEDAQVGDKFAEIAPV